MAKVRNRLADIVRDLVHGRAGLLLLCGQIQKQTFAQRRAERINGDKFSLRVFFPQFVAGDRTGLIRCAQSGGKADEEDIKTLLQFSLHDGGELRDVNGARGGAFAVAEFVVKLLEADLAAVEIVGVCMLPNQNMQRQDGKIEFIRQRLRQIAGGVCYDLKTFFHV